MSELLRLVAEKIPSEGCSLFLYDSICNNLYLEATTGLYRSKSDRLKYEMGEGLTGWVAKNRQVLRLYNIDNSDEIEAVAKDLTWANKFSEIQNQVNKSYDWRSYLGVPIYEHDHPEALLGVIRLSKRAYGEGFLALEEKLLVEVSKFLSKYYHEYWNNQYKDDLHFLSGIEEAWVSEQHNPQFVLTQILDRMNEITGTNDSYIALLSEENENFLSIFVTTGHQLEDRNETRACCKGVIGSTIVDRQSIRINTREERSRYHSDSAHLKESIVQSQLCLPLVLRGKAIGAISLHSDQSDRFRARDLPRLEMLADASSVTIDHALKFHSIAVRLSSLTAILEEIGKHTNLSDLYKAALREISKLTGAVSSALLLVDRHKQQLELEEIYNWDKLLTISTINANSIFEVDGLSSTDITKIVSKDNGVLAIESLSGMLGVPIRFKDEFLGFIMLGFASASALSLTEDTTSTLKLLANQIGLALVTSRVHSEKEFINRKREKLERSVSISSFVSSLVHDFYNKLLIIKLKQDEARQLVCKHLNEKSINEFDDIYRLVREQVAHLLELTNKIKKYKTDRKENMGEVYLNDLIRSSCTILFPYAEERKIKLKIHLDSRLDQPAKGRGNVLICDPDSLDRALENIIKNAIEHSYERQVVDVESRYIKTLSKNVCDMYEIRIIDYGEGINDFNHGDIFEPYYTTKDYGSGLGLFNAKTTIEAAAGRITFQSKRGKGSTFVIRFAKS
ncbi:MAG: GAF domain-containing protein [Syntrophobacteraceae bacterium]